MKDREKKVEEKSSPGKGEKAAGIFASTGKELDAELVSGKVLAGDMEGKRAKEKKDHRRRAHRLFHLSSSGNNGGGFEKKGDYRNRGKLYRAGVGAVQFPSFSKRFPKQKRRSRKSSQSFKKKVERGSGYTPEKGGNAKRLMEKNCAVGVPP